MKKLLVILAMAFTTFVVKGEEKVQNSSLFGNQEVGINISTGWLMERDYDVNFNAGLTYFPTRYIGVETTVPVYTTSGDIADRIEFGGVVRIPVDISIVKKNIMPYGRGGAVFNWERDTWDYYLGLGGELKINKGWGVFIDVNYYFDEFDNSVFDEGSFVSRLGLRLVL